MDDTSGIGSLRILHVALLASVLLFALIGEQLGPTEPRDVTVIRLVLTLVALLEVGVAMFFRKRMVQQAEEMLAREASNAEALKKWRAGKMVSYALAESLGVLGLALRMMGGTLTEAAPFYAGAIVLLLLWAPRGEFARQA